jgi:hypothetical protein
MAILLDRGLAVAVPMALSINRMKYDIPSARYGQSSFWQMFRRSLAGSGSRQERYE